LRLVSFLLVPLDTTNDKFTGHSRSFPIRPSLFSFASRLRVPNCSSSTITQPHQPPLHLTAPPRNGRFSMQKFGKFTAKNSCCKKCQKISAVTVSVLYQPLVLRHQWLQRNYSPIWDVSTYCLCLSSNITNSTIFKALKPLVSKHQWVIRH
jgi:hypothetical protein